MSLVVAARFIVLAALLAGVYMETGPATTLLLALVAWKIDGLVFEVGLNIWNIESIASFLDEKHTDFTVCAVGEEDEVTKEL